MKGFRSKASSPDRLFRVATFYGGDVGSKAFYDTPQFPQLDTTNGGQVYFLSVHLFHQIPPASKICPPDSLYISIKSSVKFQGQGPITPHEKIVREKTEATL
jgi:hypothetical protein